MPEGFGAGDVGPGFVYQDSRTGMKVDRKQFPRGAALRDVKPNRDADSDAIVEEGHGSETGRFAWPYGHTRWTAIRDAMPAVMLDQPSQNDDGVSEAEGPSWRPLWGCGAVDPDLQRRPVTRVRDVFAGINPGWRRLGGLVPAGLPGIVVRGSDHVDQRALFVPAGGATVSDHGSQAPGRFSSWRYSVCGETLDHRLAAPESTWSWVKDVTGVGLFAVDPDPPPIEAADNDADHVRRAVVAWNLTSDPGGTGYGLFADRQFGVTQRVIGAFWREGPKEDANGRSPSVLTPPSLPPGYYSQNLLGCASHEAGGPWNAGMLGDKHEHGRNSLGEPINAGHTSILAIRNRPGRGPDWDAPAEHNLDFYQPAKFTGFWWRVEMRYDKIATHQFMGRELPGLWRRELRLPWAAPTEVPEEGVPGGPIKIPEEKVGLPTWGGGGGGGGQPGWGGPGGGAGGPGGPAGGQPGGGGAGGGQGQRNDDEERAERLKRRQQAEEAERQREAEERRREEEEERARQEAQAELDRREAEERARRERDGAGAPQPDDDGGAPSQDGTLPLDPDWDPFTQGAVGPRGGLPGVFSVEPNPPDGLGVSRSADFRSEREAALATTYFTRAIREKLPAPMTWSYLGVGAPALTIFADPLVGRDIGRPTVNDDLDIFKATRRPAVLRFSGFGSVSGKGFDETTPRGQTFLAHPTGPGGAIFSAPEYTVHRSGTYARSAGYLGFHPELAVGFGLPLNGVLVDGALWTMSGSAGSRNLSLAFTDASGVSRNGTLAVTGHVTPGANNSTSLGSAALKWAQLHCVTVGSLTSPITDGYFTDLTVADKLTVGGLIDPTGLVLTEQASNPWTPAAGYGALWVKNTTPSSLWWADDAGNELQLTNGASGIGYWSRTGTVLTPVNAGDFLSLSAGSNAAAGLAWFFASDTDTGCFRFGSNDMRFVAGGTESLLVTSGNVRFVLSYSQVDASVSSPTYSYTNDTDIGRYRIGANDDGWVVGGSLGAGNYGAVHLTTTLFGRVAAGAVLDLGASAARWASTYLTTLDFAEQASNPITTAAGRGQLWVRSDAPCALHCEDDAGFDSPVALADRSVNITDAGNVGGGEDNLMAYTVPGGILGTANARIDFEAVFTLAAATVRVRVKFGATTVYDSATMTLGSTDVLVVRGSILRVDATNQRAWAAGVGAADNATYTTPGETLSGDVTLQCTGESTTASNDDIVQKVLRVRLVPAP